MGTKKIPKWHWCRCDVPGGLRPGDVVQLQKRSAFKANRHTIPWKFGVAMTSANLGERVRVQVSGYAEVRVLPIKP